MGRKIKTIREFLNEQQILSYQDVTQKQKIGDPYFDDIFSDENSEFVEEKIHIEKLRELNGFHNDVDDELEQTVSNFEDIGLDEDYYVSKELMNKIVNGTKLSPIVVDEKYKILDGRHRLAAYSELWFYYGYDFPFDGNLEIYKRKETRKSIDTFKQRMINENLDVNDYINQLNNNEYSKLSDNLYSDIEDEGWLEQLEDFYNRKFNKNDFSFTTLNLTSKDKNGLIEFDGDAIEKFNDFDIRLKSMSEYPFNKLDLIDYDNGVVYIIRLDMELRKFESINIEKLVDDFINHFNDSSNFNINNIPKEILNKFPDFSTNPISYKNRLGRNEKIYAGVKSGKNISNIGSWTLDEETAVAFSEKHNNGKVIELTYDEFFNNFQYFVSMDVIYDYILKKGLYNEKLNRYYSESEIVILKK